MTSQEYVYRVSNKCFAYENLKRQIGQQCRMYRRLSKSGELGSLPGMYQENEFGRTVPSKDVSAFFRGGIIAAMACFEGFVIDLLDETRDTILYQREQCPADCEDCQGLRFSHVVSKRERNIPPRMDVNQWNKQKENLKPPAETYKIKEDNVPSLLHVWNKAFSCAIGCNDFTDIMFEHCPINYFYPVDHEKVSHLEIKNCRTVCTFLKFFHDIGCIMSHGSAELKLSHKKSFNDYDKCRHCDRKKYSAITSLNDISELSTLFDKCIEVQGKEKALKTSRHFPRHQSFVLLENTERERAEAIIDQYCVDSDGLYRGQRLLNANYALFHMCRVFHWLKENKRMMYITYRMLLRINQFILLLAFRMRIAVAYSLSLMNTEGENWVEDGIFGVRMEKIQDKIKKFETEHKLTVMKFQNDK